MNKSRLLKFLLTPFGLAVVGLVVLAGWSLWTAGIADNAMQRAARTGSIYAADGVDLDTEAATKIIGNRRLFVAFVNPETDLSDACEQTERPAGGTLVLLLSHKAGDDDYEAYGCSQLPGASDDNFGNAYVAESIIHQGIDVFVDRPLEAVKNITVNYDLLAKADMVPVQARSITPSLPRYLIALAAVLAVLIGSAAAYLSARRAGKHAAQLAESRAALDDADASLNAKAAVVAQHIIELDRRYESRSRTAEFAAKYREIVADYTSLTDDLAAKSSSVDELGRRFDDLVARCGSLK